MEIVENAWFNVREKTRRLSEGIGSLRNSPVKERAPLGFERFQKDEEPLSIRLGDVGLVYDNAEWYVEGDAPTTSKKEVDELTEQNRKLEAENQLLKFKVNVLLDILASAKLDVAQLQHDMEKEY